jgi:hypothetical protein
MERLIPRALDAVYRLCIWSAAAAIVCMSLIRHRDRRRRGWPRGRRGFRP